MNGIPKGLPQYEKPKPFKPAVIPAGLTSKPAVKPVQYVKVYGNKHRPRS